ncbi:seven-hairpin glycosidase [Auriculariales sp. MPI-PUGE-AT-0066]|nr:seven-hairpin glycosidase [Auriculariales sp. MPI-PUGE-AT-0066]
MLSPSLRIVAAFSLLFFREASAGSIQKDGLQVPQEYVQYRETVKQMFLDGYGVYNSMLSVKMRSTQWLMTTFVAPFTASKPSLREPPWRVGCHHRRLDVYNAHYGSSDLYAEGLDHVKNTDFSKSDGIVSLFETTIRYIGGMLSSYELNGKKDQALVDAARVLGDKLAFAWVDSNVLPYNSVNFRNNSAMPNSAGPAEAGTLILEWGRLSEHTGNDTYLRLTDKAFRALATLTDTLLPALPGGSLNAENAAPVDSHITWGGGTDSYLEYLIKYARLSNNADMLWVNTWKTAVDSSLAHLAQRTETKNWLMLADMNQGGKLSSFGSHLACFTGGNWIMGGKLIGNDTILQAGLELTDACMNTYTSTAWRFKGDDSAGQLHPLDPQDDPSSFEKEHGFSIGTATYQLRPEVLESNFYAWRATGETKYLDNAVAAINAFQKYLKVESGGYAVLQDVNHPENGIIDNTPSFFFAETLKYLYLTFDDPTRWSLDEVVFNTEAHPFLAPSALASYNEHPDAVNVPSGSGSGTKATQSPGTPQPTNAASQSTSAGSFFVAFGLFAFLLC